MKRTKKVTGLMLAVMTTFIMTACGKEKQETFQRMTNMIQNCTQVSQGSCPVWQVLTPDSRTDEGQQR